MRRALEDPSSVLWVDFETTDRREGELLASLFRFHPLAIDDCYNAHVDPAKIDDYGTYLFLVIQGVRYFAQGARLETTELDLFLGPNYVVSFHQFPFPGVAALAQRVEQSAITLERGADFLAHTLIDVLVDEFLPVVQALDDTVETLEEQVLAQPQPAVLQSIMLVRRNAQRLRRAALPQRDVVNRLARGEFPSLVRDDMRIYFRDIYDHIIRVEQMVEDLRDLAEGALNTYLSAVNNRLNEVMKALSLAAVVFLPMSLLAGIWGMNFEHMPELGWSWAYFAALGTIGLTGVASWAVFRLRGWI